MSSCCASSDPVGECRRLRPCLGTFVEIAGTGDPDAVERAVSAAFAAVERVQRAMSVHDPESDLSRLNRESHLAPQRCRDPWTLEVLRLALGMAAESDGLFDPTVGRHLIRFGFLARTVARQRLGPASYQDIEIDGDQIRFRRPLVLDFGGIAKGFAVDRALDTLREHGLCAGLVNAGGDLSCFGPPVGVCLRHPAAPRLCRHRLELANRALATSGAQFARRRFRGDWVSHIVHPESGDSWTATESVSVLAGCCWVADALTKIVALDPPRGQVLLLRHGAEAFRLAGTRVVPIELAEAV